MKITSILILGFSFLLTTCGGQKLKLEDQDVLSFKKATYDKWSAGIQGGGAGYAIALTLDENQHDVVLKKIVFKKWVAPLNPGDDNTYYASINDGTNNSSGSSIVIGSAQQLKASEEVDSIPVALEDEEAILYYLKGTVEKYYKLKLTKATNFNTPRY